MRRFPPPRVSPHLALLLTATLLGACGGGDDRADPMEAGDARAAFFGRVAALCGQSFAGAPTFVPSEDHPMAGARLEMHVAECTDEEIRIPFVVNGDRSRTWVLTRADSGLLFKHDHRHADGTPEDTTMYGGWARRNGSPTRQAFPADAHTAEIIPDAVTNVWTLEIQDEPRRFIYDLQRHGRPRFRAEFDLTTARGTAQPGG